MYYIWKVYSRGPKESSFRATQEGREEAVISSHFYNPRTEVFCPCMKGPLAQIGNG